MMISDYRGHVIGVTPNPRANGARVYMLAFFKFPSVIQHLFTKGCSDLQNAREHTQPL